MKFGVAVLLKSPVVDREALKSVAQTAEALGFDWVGLNDRVVHPVQVSSKYPYTQSGEVGPHWLKRDGQVIADSLETLTSLSFLAGCTERIGLATMVLVLPYRPPVLAAKMLATADVLSGGRVIAGVGPGWLREEYDALQNPFYEGRGAVVDEYLASFRELFTEAEPSFDGKYVRFDDIVFAPKPVDNRIPVWIAGESSRSLRRVAEYGDGWCPATTSPRVPLDTVTGFAHGMELLERACDKHDRDVRDIDIVLWPGRFPRDGSPDTRVPFYGEPQAVIDDIAAYAEHRLTGLTLHLQGNGLSETLDNMHRYAEDVLPHVR
ncbi:putative F420-dependent oxidoreductase [Streptomyces aurantiacus]|uniref:TIGR03619 family F420-dependent LLM class oxidoreductase n=1 Tax=Streptomyces aurantiacus TaxID=47760 RepID=UPI00278D61E6|nr:TIGR03619 family F420-dependent LLM class oxidoreductase [Streptomyces aurantiacus]MDQ0771575.1 putative F420-dependent oxidoreductase [Streptomyces aurantiacus]